ncbi:hypothetical protein HAX54_020826 [Datura stramonium]|uniref:Uncharacterized protein n=1 Tax=Datura stramonium TaxID=4076 RepID=A0ABS8S596_DATST|nr:hypothetical protein [Datura stramonium]
MEAAIVEINVELKSFEVYPLLEDIIFNFQSAGSDLRNISYLALHSPANGTRSNRVADVAIKVFDVHTLLDHAIDIVKQAKKLGLNRKSSRATGGGYKRSLRDSEQISPIVREEIEDEREMLQLADRLRGEMKDVKLSEAKNHFEEKNSAIDKLRKQVEAFMGKNSSLNFRKSNILE